MRRVIPQGTSHGELDTYLHGDRPPWQMLRKVGIEPILKQLLLKFYQERRPQKQFFCLFVCFLSPTSFPSYFAIFFFFKLYYLFYNSFILLFLFYLYLCPVSAHFPTRYSLPLIEAVFPHDPHFYCRQQTFPLTVFVLPCWASPNLLVSATQ